MANSKELAAIANNSILTYPERIKRLTDLFFKFDSGPIDIGARKELTRLMLQIESLATKMIVDCPKRVHVVVMDNQCGDRDVIGAADDLRTAVKIVESSREKMRLTKKDGFKLTSTQQIKGGFRMNIHGDMANIVFEITQHEVQEVK